MDKKHLHHEEEKDVEVIQPIAEEGEEEAFIEQL